MSHPTFLLNKNVYKLNQDVIPHVKIVFCQLTYTKGKTDNRNQRGQKMSQQSEFGTLESG